MSLGIAFKGPEGIVLAADSRVTLTAEVQSQGGQRMFLPATYDNATKLLKVKGQNFMGAVTYGAGALGAPPRTAHSYLPEFENELGEGRISVEEFAQKLSNFFDKQWQSASMPADAEPMVFLVGGYDEDAAYGRVFRMSVPKDLTPMEMNPGEDFGVTWGGQLESATRLLNGYDPSLFQIIQGILGLSDTEAADLQTQVSQALGGVSPPIPYAFLPLQDCVDLAILLVKTTAALQRFAVGIRGVGGAIDVATITRTEGFKAVQQKRITGEHAEV